MRILIINTRYFVSGGPETYMFKLKALLEARRHEVIPFAITYDRNCPTPHASYFAEPLSDPSEVYFNEQRPTIRAYAKSIERAFYARDVYGKLAALVEKTQPDVAYVINWQRKLSPSVLTCLSRHNVPFAAFLPDFVMVCPEAHLLRNALPCELCVTGELRHSVKYRCVQGSAAASMVNYAAVRFHQRAGFYHLIRKFVAPSRFMAQMMIKGGFVQERVETVPMFISVPEHHAALSDHSSTSEPLIVYVGRMEHSKGVHVLLEAVRRLAGRSQVPPFRVSLLGTGDAEYTRTLREFVRRHGLRHVTFEGWKSADEVAATLKKARCSVVPSIWYENTPNTALESMAAGVPILASDHGCFRELADGELADLLFAPGNANELADRLARLLENRELARRLGTEAREFVLREHSPERHYDLLMQVFAQLGARVDEMAPGVSA